MHASDLHHRLNYIIWLQDLVDSTAGGLHEGYDQNREVVGLDMYVFFTSSHDPEGIHPCIKPNEIQRNRMHQHLPPLGLRDAAPVEVCSDRYVLKTQGFSSFTNLPNRY